MAATGPVHLFGKESMHVRSITASALAALLLSGTAASAAGLLDPSHEPRRSAPHEAGPSGSQRVAGLFDLFSGNDNDADRSVEMAQAGDPRVTQLEEEIRKLSGTIEELNFQVLQMQEQMRKMQEDNEFRFQQLENGGTAAGSAEKKSEVPPAREDTTGGAAGDTTATVAPKDNRAADAQDGTTAMPGVELGTITVDKDGNVKSTTLGEPTDPSGGGANSSDGTAVAALPSSDDPDEVYRNAYEFVLQGDYPTAEAGFRNHIDRFPADPRTADARYWLGEAMLGQKKYRDAAEVFLAANRDYPDAAKAPDMLLKLGVSLKELKQRDVACATFKEVTKRYPRTSDALRQRVKQEQALAGC
jgi:tol-pal system protein YbgF